MIRLALALGLVLTLGLSPWSVNGAAAQSPTVIASGLDNPRGLTFGPNGELYVAEAGRGGDQQTVWGPPFGSATVGTSGRITRIDGGQKQVIASGLQSVALGPAAEMVGPEAIAFIGSTMYAVVGEQNPLPNGTPTHSLLVRFGPDGKPQATIDLGKYEETNDPDKAGADSNPFDLVVGADGNLYVVDAGANAVLKVTPAGDVSVVVAWPDDPVPTAIAFDKSGMMHVAFLSHFPFATGSARVDMVMDGKPSVMTPNLTAVTDLATGPDGAIYALQLASEFSMTSDPPNFKPKSGSVLRLGSGAPRTVLSGLNYPTKMAFGPDGSLYVSINGAYDAPGNGQVVRFTAADLGDQTAAAPTPVPTSAPTTAPAAPRPATPATPAAAPVQTPAALPRTGAPFGPETVPLLAGTALVLAGAVLRRRR